MKRYGIPVLGFAGFSGSGKTTLIEQLIPLLKHAGLRIGVVKHSHHHIEPDPTTKDSYRLRHAGAMQLLLATPMRNMVFFEHKIEKEPILSECLAQLDCASLDIILVEGFRDQALAKVEVHRPILGKPLLYLQDENIIAIASDEYLPLSTRDVRLLPLNAPKCIADFILENTFEG